MKQWEDRVADFLTDYETKELDELNLELFIKEGLNPMLDELTALRAASNELVETNLSIFKRAFEKPNPKMKTSRLYKALRSVLRLTSDYTNAQ